jgi:hypothetical protein
LKHEGQTEICGQENEEGYKGDEGKGEREKEALIEICWLVRRF